MRQSVHTTLRKAWITSALQLMVIIVALGTITVGTTYYLHSAFQETTSQVEAEMAAVTSLRSAIVNVAAVATPVIYGFDESTTAASNLATYQAGRAQLTDQFASAQGIFEDADSMAILQQMIDGWQEFDLVILAAPALRAPSSFTDIAAEGDDPFVATVWEPYNELHVGLGELSEHTVTSLRARISSVDRVYGMIVPVVLGSVVVALVLSWLAALRISRRVLAPLTVLREAAVAMRNAQVDEPIVLTHAVAELHDLARTINETAAALYATHDVLRHQASSDALTGLPNRRAFIEMIEGMFLDAANGCVCVLFIDLDDFKIVNDSLGHAAGDELLCVVARRLRSVARDGETVARLGGDEFAIVLNAHGPEAAVAIAHRTLAILQEPLNISGTMVSVGCSIGVALSDPQTGAGTADELVRNADFAMYMAKSQGKNRFEVFASTLHDESLGRVQFKSELANALHQEQFVLEYQPVVELETRALIGFEALIRWQHPTLGLLAPSEFISLAEATGDIVAIGGWMLNEACCALAEHHRQQDRDQPPLWMSVNVSPIEIANPGFLETVNEALARHGASPRSLMIEITEGVALTDPGAAGLVLGALRSSGVRLALDDFGTGFSSLHTLHELPIDVIKIDRSFLAKAAGGTKKALMLEAVVTLGHGLGLDIIAEGIETQHDLDRLAAFRIAGQGYLFAPPLSPAAAAKYRDQAAALPVAAMPAT